MKKRYRVVIIHQPEEVEEFREQVHQVDPVVKVQGFETSVFNPRATGIISIIRYILITLFQLYTTFLFWEFMGGFTLVVCIMTLCGGVRCDGVMLGRMEKEYFVGLFVPWLYLYGNKTVFSCCGVCTFEFKIPAVV